MPEPIIYLLKANLVLLLFFAAYRLLLRKLTFYTYNRGFLVIAILVSTIFPLLDISWFFREPSELSTGIVYILPNWTGETGVDQEHGGQFDGQWLLLLYLGGVMLMMARFILQLASLRQLHKRSVFKVWQGQGYRELQEQVSPFSFWRNIYLNPKQHTEPELKALLLHEQVHVQQLHTLDVLLGQLAGVVYWFNPVVWFMQQDISQNLEYIADKQTLQQGIDTRHYQYSLLHVGKSLLKENSLTMSFNFNHIKDRIMMMNKQRSNPMQKLKYLLLPPAVLVLALLATTSKADTEMFSQSLGEEPELSLKSHATGTTISASAQDTVAYLVNGKRVSAASIKGLDPNTIEKVEVTKGEKAQSLVSDPEIKGVVNITTKANASPNLSGKAVSGGNMGDSLKDLPQNAVFILDDKEVSPQEIKNLSPESIKSVNVVKNSEQMVKKYGPKAKNGVIMIYTK